MNQQFKGHRTVLTRTITIDSTPDIIFPLLCPVRENDWADGWAGRPVYSESGFAEENGLFASRHEGEEDTLWFVTRRDAAAHEIEFVYFVPQLQVARLNVRVAPLAAGRSTIDVTYIRTGISEAGNESVRKSEARFGTMMTEWETSLNHYIRTGHLLDLSH